MLYRQQIQSYQPNNFYFLLHVEVVVGDTQVAGFPLEVFLAHLLKMPIAFSVVTCPFDALRMLHFLATLCATVIINNR